MTIHVPTKNILFLLLTICFALNLFSSENKGHFIQVSERDCRYLEFDNGKPYIPIGLNMLQAYGSSSSEHMGQFEEWMKQLSENGGNYIRVWLSSPFWDIEHEKSGEYDEEKAKRIDELLALAKKYDIRVKMTIEHFRYFESERRQWAAKPIHHISQGGPAKNIADFFDGEKSRTQFKKKLAWYAERYGNDPIIYGWELWNEMDTVRGGDYMTWTKIMLTELHTLFPKNLAMQSLGSFDHPRKRDIYRQMSLMDGNDIAQVHRYLDLGANLEICHGPVDLLTADAVRELLVFAPKKPVILAESGAVEPGHSGPFKLYKEDKDGIILHDVLFAPFFAGAAGTGQIWHWDHYVAANDLWWQFNRFAEAVEGIDPPTENFEPLMLQHPRLRIYALKGKQTILLWCRDSRNTWKSELEEKQLPEVIQECTLDVSSIMNRNGNYTIQTYDPWKNEWSSISMQDTTLSLPAFQRSIVVKCEVNP